MSQETQFTKVNLKNKTLEVDHTAVAVNQITVNRELTVLVAYNFVTPIFQME